MTAPAPEDGSALCTACGLCCTGALHDRAVLDEDEVDGARALGLPVQLPQDLKAGFRLPCPKLDGTFCTIYTERPRVCARYACRLLQEVRGGERSLAGALPLVAEARRLAGEVSAALKPGQSLPAARGLLADPAAPADTALLRLRSAALAHYLDLHFRNAREGPWLTAEPVAKAPTGETCP